MNWYKRQVSWLVASAVRVRPFPRCKRRSLSIKWESENAAKWSRRKKLHTLQSMCIGRADLDGYRVISDAVLQGLKRLIKHRQEASYKQFFDHSFWNTNGGAWCLVEFPLSFVIWTDVHKWADIKAAAQKQRGRKGEQGRRTPTPNPLSHFKSPLNSLLIYFRFSSLLAAA
jgi:hypothetical protein